MRKLYRFKAPIVLRRIKGHSMQPKYMPGDLVVASSFIQPKVGKVVIADVGTYDVIKRIGSISEGVVELHGDNSSDSKPSTTTVNDIRAVVL